MWLVPLEKKKQFELFHRLDNWQNIRYNKISALSRNEPKDLADILFICKKFYFSWVEVIYQAKEKDMWVEKIEISRPIMNWAILPNYEELENLKKKIALYILLGKNNLP